MADPAGNCWALLGEAAAGGERERSAFASRYEPVLRAYIDARWARSSLADLAHDASQAMLEECFRQGRSLQETHWETKSEFRSFLYKIALGIAFKQETKSKTRVDADEESLSAAFERTWAVQMMKLAARKQAQKAQDDKEALKRLELLRIHFYGGYSLSTIADLWKTDVEQLRQQYEEAKRGFAAALREVVVFHHPGGDSEKDECARLLALCD